MSYRIRPATLKDVGRIAYLMLVWDAELPPHVKMLNGDAAQAERTATQITSDPCYVTQVLEVNSEVVGVMVISVINGLFCAKPYGVLNLVVHPKQRSGKLYGLHLLNKAVELARQAQLAWLESNPWADAHGMQFVLDRLGFMELTRGYALRLSS